MKLVNPFFIVAIVTSLACSGGVRERDQSSAPAPAPPRALGPADAEADEIRQLLAYAVAAARWEGSSATRTGHNVAAVLVSPGGLPVWWERNSNAAEHSSIEHAEARLIRGYVASRHELGRPVPQLTGYTVYATLEPCAMCIGTMIMAQIDRVVWGQVDPIWGKAAERLAFDSRAQNQGLAPYHRHIDSVPSASPFRTRLDEAYRPQQSMAITEWLDGEEAERIFMESVRALQRFTPKHDANRAVLDAARAQYQLAAANRHR